MAGAPAFDPSKPFEPVAAPAFDPSKPFEPVGGARPLTTTMLDALSRGAARGATANWYEEGKAAGEAGRRTGEDIPQVPGLAKRESESPNSLNALISGIYRKIAGDPEAQKRFEDALAKENERTKTLQTERPGAMLAGEIGGAVALPGGSVMQAATLPARVGRTAAVGAGYGALSGAGEGEGLADRVSRAVTGGVIGGTAGAASPFVSKGIEKAGEGISYLARPITQAWRGMRDPEAEAARRVLEARARDTASGRGGGLTEAEMEAARLSGQPVVNADMGGAETMSLARSSANTSAEGRSALEAVTSDRFATQKPRTAQFIKETFDFPDVGGKLDQLTAAAQATNRPAYLRAYNAPSAKGIWDEGLEQFAQAPTMQQAIRMAFVTARDKGALEGLPAFKNPFVVNAAGGLELKTDAAGNRMLPNLQFWDHVKRNLDKMGGDAPAFAKALRNHLDEIVPAYKDARAGAAKFFGAEDALEAGANFARMSGLDSIKLAQARNELAKMNEAERKLFETGFVSNLIAKVESLKDGQDIVKNIFQSEFARKQIELAVGKDKAAMLEAHLITERAMDRLRGALGNSSTTRQLYEMGKAGATNPYTIAGAAAGATTYASGSVGPGDAFAAALAFGARKGQLKIDERVAARVGEMLASSSPEMLNKGLRIVSNNPELKKALLAFDAPSARVGAQQLPGMVPSIQGPMRAAAEGESPQPPGVVQ